MAGSGEAPPVWVLTDDRPGNANQALGLADALGLPYAVKPIAYNSLASLPNLLLGAGSIHVRKASAAGLRPPWPELIIAAGRRTAPVARAIKRRSGGRARLVQLMWPGRPTGDIDVIVAPEHDRLPADRRLLRAVGAPNRVTPGRLAEAAEAWAARLAAPAPRLALLVGGDSRAGRFGPALARDLGHATRGLADGLGASILVTTSRRTGEDSANALEQALGPVAHWHRWQPAPADNPYLALLGLADVIVVTGDSASMCTEACSTGKPVHIFAPPRLASPKIAALHADLRARGLAEMLGVSTDMAAARGFTPAGALREADRIAAELRGRLGLPRAGA